MTEAQISFLVKAASSFNQTNSTQNILKSYYLMRCRDATKGLPERYFSSKVRCSHCFKEWDKETKTNVEPIKLSKRQRRRIRNLKVTNLNKDYVQSRKNLVNSNELAQTCTFCQHVTKTQLLKPPRPKITKTHASLEAAKLKNNVNKPTVKPVLTTKAKTQKKEINITSKLTKPNTPKDNNANLYSNAKAIFSLSNKNNDLTSMVKDKKVIKNNKKKKDKFAGLCQQAVLASAKLKEEKEKEKEKPNKLSMFLKPST